jgi:hypothetical protein
MCDARCEAIFSADTVSIRHNNQPVFRGWRSPDGLWKIKLLAVPNPVLPQAHFSVFDASTKHVIKFLHQCLFSPTTSILFKVLKIIIF